MSTHKPSRRTSDRRIQYTRMILRESLLEMMQEIPLERITVTALCQKADINRGTFYAHYRDPYDLLSQIEEAVLQEIIQVISHYGESIDPMGTSPVIQDIFRYIAKNQDICTIILGQRGEGQFLARVLDYIKPTIFSMWHTHFGRQDPVYLEYLFAFIVEGSIGIARRWIATGTKQPAQLIAAMLEAFSTGGLQGFLQKQDIFPVSIDSSFPPGD